MQRNIRFFLLALLTFLLAGCNLPTRGQNLPTPTEDMVATQVAQLLTTMPTATAAMPAQTPTVEQGVTETPPAPSATATPPAATATLAQAGTPSPTIPASDPKSALGNPAWKDTLDTGKLFYLYENDNTRVTAENGALLLTGIAANGWMGWSLTFNHPAQNFYLEAVFSPQTCSGSDQYGLVFRAPSTEAGYFFVVTCDGKFGLQARDFKDGTDVVKIEMTPGSTIQTGSNAVNRLGVWANGDRIRLYANGTMLKEITDTAYPAAGDFGALVAANVTPGFTVKMDEIAMWDLPGY